MAGAGCGSHRCSVVDRDGAVIAELDTLVAVEWSRVLDDTSTAHVRIVPQGDCCMQLGNVRTWRHRLVISRDGQHVWDGPIIQAEWRQGQVDLFALDIMGWLDRRVPHEDITFADSDLTDIATWLIEDGFKPDDPGYDLQVMGRSRVNGGREYEAGIGQTGDHLRDLADSGIDYTAVGNKILLLPEDWSASVGTLADSDMPEGMVVVEDGAALATRWIVHGREGSGIYGEWGGADGYYGLLERSVEDSSITTDQAATDAARSRRNASLPVPVFLASDEVTLSPDATVNVAHLVPGWCVDVQTVATCRDLAQRMKILGVRVTEDGDQGETVQVTLAPVSDSQGVS